MMAYMESATVESQPSDQARPRDLIVVGAGGLAAEYLWVAEAMNQAVAAGRPAPWKILGCCVYDPSLYPAEILSYRVLGTPQDVARNRGAALLHFICGIGDNQIREKEAKIAESLGWVPVTLIHPSCHIAPNATIGPGTFIAAGAVVGPYAIVGAHVIINIHVSVGHDSSMGDFSQACPGARISGRCTVGRSAFLASNATLIPGISLGERAVLGANSVAIRSLGPDLTASGVPARPLLG
jgi:sugar O-acyltransferase (sialic acid O-acetyltransferase NeuD family)